tara:strand:- start:298 stop:783 length:486 start_codon:yes stop_codon:yes gene_type:complete
MSKIGYLFQYKKASPETMKKNIKEYEEKYSDEMKWLKDNFSLIKDNKFMMSMYTILITGSRKMTPKMIESVRKNIKSPKYDPIKMIERKEKMKPIIEKINRVWELVAEIDEDRNDYYLANFSALPFVDSIKKQAIDNGYLSEKQLKALNKVYKKYKNKGKK